MQYTSTVRSVAVFVAIAALLQFSQAVSAQPPAESVEPPLKFTLLMAGKPQAIAEDTPIRIHGAFEDPEVILKADAFRTFPYRGVSFRYPRHFTFEADLEDKESLRWTLSGNDLKIMLFDMSSEITPEQYCAALIEQFGKNNCRIVDRKLKGTFGRHVLEGMSMRTSLVGHSMVMDVYRVASSMGKTRLLVLQDSLGEKGDRTKEGLHAISLLRESFSITQ